MKLLALLLLPVFSFCQMTLDQTISMPDQNVELSIPKELSPISDELWKIKYGAVNRPTMVYSDKKAEANLIGNITNQIWEEQNIEAYRDFRIENLKKTRTDIEVLESGTKEVSGRKVAFFKFMSKAIDTRIFNQYFFVVVDNEVLMFTINYPEKLKVIWDKISYDIIALALRYKSNIFNWLSFGSLKYCR